MRCSYSQKYEVLTKLRTWPRSYEESTPTRTRTRHARGRSLQNTFLKNTTFRNAKRQQPEATTESNNYSQTIIAFTQEEAALTKTHLTQLETMRYKLFPLDIGPLVQHQCFNHRANLQIARTTRHHQAVSNLKFLEYRFTSRPKLKL